VSSATRTRLVASVLTEFDVRDPRYDRVLDQWLQGWEPTPGGAPALHFELTEAPHPPPDGCPVLAFAGLEVWRRDGRVTVARSRDLGASLDLDSGDGVVWATDPIADGPWQAVHSCLRPVWSMGLARRGLHVLHASAVEIDGHALVITGRSGDGKSTLARRLAAWGATSLSDDLAFLVEDATSVAGLGDFSRVHASHAEAEQLVGYALPDGKVAVGTDHHVSAAVPIAAVLVLGHDGAAPTRLSPGDAMAQLLVSSGFMTLDAQSDPGRLATLARLTSAVPMLGLPRRPTVTSLASVRAWLADL
jgi:hypothetical protein